MTTRTALQSLLWVVAFGLAALTAMSFLGELWWAFDVVTHFRPYLALAALAAALAALATATRAAGAVLLAALVANALPLVPRIAAAAALTCGAPGSLRFLTLNLHGRGTDPAAFRRLIETERPDVVLLTELPRDLSPLIRDLPALPPHRLIDQRGSGFDVALFTRWPIADWQLERADGLPVLAADFCPRLDDGEDAHCLRVVGLHATRPIGDRATLQDAQLDLATHLVAGAPDGNAVLLGDLNLTPWSARFRDLLAETGLSDVAMREPLEATWRSPLPFVGLVIDHVLVSRGLAVSCGRLGRETGSDHLPVVADMSFAPMAARAGEMAGARDVSVTQR